MSMTLATDENFGSMARQMGKVLEQLNKGYYSFSPNETWTPNVNLYETEQRVLVCVDLAGVDKEKIDIEVVDQRLTHQRHAGRADRQPQARRPRRRQWPRSRVHLMEIDHGSFRRQVELPHDVRHDKITADAPKRNCCGLRYLRNESCRLPVAVAESKSTRNVQPSTRD